MASARLLSHSETQINRLFVLSTYRHLLRATRIAFKGDELTLLASRTFARAQFASKRHLDTGGPEAAQALEHVQGVTQILRENVVQGRNKGGETYKLNIHEHTQRLDNDTAGQLKGTTKSFKQIKGERF